MNFVLWVSDCVSPVLGTPLRSIIFRDIGAVVEVSCYYYYILSKSIIWIPDHAILILCVWLFINYSLWIWKEASPGKDLLIWQRIGLVQSRRGIYKRNALSLCSRGFTWLLLYITQCIPVGIHHYVSMLIAHNKILFIFVI